MQQALGLVVAAGGTPGRVGELVGLVELGVLLQVGSRDEALARVRARADAVILSDQQW